MAAGSAFTLVPNLVTTLVPEYNNVQSQTESMKKEYFNISATPVESYRIDFNAITSAVRDTILTHYKDQSGGYYPFSWTSVPSYIGSGSNITGRWVEGSLSMEKISNRWKVSISFEKAN
jgi:hypothetical protein